MTKYINEKDHIRQIPEGMEKPEPFDESYRMIYETEAQYKEALTAYQSALASQPTFLKIGDGWEKYGIGDTVDGGEVETQLQFYAESSDLWLDTGDWVTIPYLEEANFQYREVARLKHKEAGEESETLFWVLLDGGTSSHYRMEYFKGKKTIHDFFNWLQVRQNEVELKESRSMIIKDMKFLNSKTINP